MALSQDSLRKIDRELAKFPADQRQSAVMAALRIAQTEQGWLSSEVMQEIADYIGMPAIAVYEVASFYTMYNLKPVGKYKLTVCTNLPCQLRDGQKALHHLEKKLGVSMGETTPDGFAVKAAARAASSGNTCPKDSTSVSTSSAKNGWVKPRRRP